VDVQQTVCILDISKVFNQYKYLKSWFDTGFIQMKAK
jgi:hypothetical protein